MIIGITGSFGAGKGAVVDYLVSKKHFTHFSARNFITEEIKRRGLSIDRDAMIFIGNELRKTHGPAYIIESLFTKADKTESDAVIESLRAVAEVRKLKELGGIIIGVDAKPELRYERAIGRGSETDKVSFKEWKRQEQEESNPTDPAKQNIFGALKESDYIIMNNGSVKDLHVEIEKLLNQIEADGA